MGGHRCIVFGCKSGHRKGLSKKEKEKLEKFYYFQVPRVDLELWQRALIRKDIVIKPGHSVCEKHFPKEDLLWRKVLRAPDGTILGVSADYKAPKLRKGALPSLLLGLTPDGKPEKKPRENPRDKYVSVTKLKVENIDVIPNDVIDEEQNEVEMRNHASVECTLEIPDEIEEIPLFEMIFNNEKSVALPFGWCRQNMKYAGKRLVHFCQFLPRMEDEIIQPFCIKQILVDENLETNILIMRQQVDKEKSYVQKEPISSPENLEQFLQVVNSWRLCSGLSVSDNQVMTSSVRQDKNGVLRNIHCSLYLPATSRSGCCEECKRSKKTIVRKTARLKNESDSPRFRVSNLNAHQRRKLEEMRRDLKTIRRGRERALARIKALKDLRNREREAYKAKQKTIEQILSESSLDGNQKLVMWEMLSASRQVNSRARRYSRVWISFCLSLHRKSPVTYRFLRQNNVLPLPAPKTILRFAQQNPSEDPNASHLNIKADAITDATTENVTLEDDIVPEEEMPNVELETEVT